MRREPVILLGLSVAACAAATTPPDEQTPLLRDTTLQRQDGTPLSIEELQSIRYSAIATADTIARAERELAEPWAELRAPDVIVENVTLRYPTDTRLARTLWEGAEPVGRGQDRGRFREYGYYSNQFSPTLFAASARPATLEGFVAELLTTHSDATPTLALLAAWRRFAPMMGERGHGYLSSSWQFELDYIEPINVSLSESLLGPHLRCGVSPSDSVSFPGPRDSFDGYSTSVMLIDLLLPGPESPVLAAVSALTRAATGESVPLPFSIAGSDRRTGDDLDVRFLLAAMRGLAQGCCQPLSLPASTRRFSVTFSYLLDLAEARASMTFKRTGTGWELELFEYQPAAANLIGGSATLDLIPAVRELALRNQRG